MVEIFFDNEKFMLIYYSDIYTGIPVLRTQYTSIPSAKSPNFAFCTKFQYRMTFFVIRYWSVFSDLFDQMIWYFGLQRHVIFFDVTPNKSFAKKNNWTMCAVPVDCYTCNEVPSVTRDTGGRVPVP
jgi:hypothetical protein